MNCCHELFAGIAVLGLVCAASGRNWQHIGVLGQAATASSGYRGLQANSNRSKRHE